MVLNGMSTDLDILAVVAEQPTSTIMVTAARVAVAEAVQMTKADLQELPIPVVAVVVQDSLLTEVMEVPE